MEISEAIINQGHGYISPSYLVIHETANPEASAVNHVSYWKNNPNAAMTHYVTDWNQIVYHTVYDDRLCWHVGNGNSRCVGIELCNTSDSVKFARVWNTGVEFAAYYLNNKGWGIDRLISHDDARRMWGGTDHTDPISYFKAHGKSWAQFVSEVEKAMKPDAWTVQMYETNDTDAQKFRITWDGDWFTLTCLADGRALDVTGAGKTSGTRVQVYTPNGTDAQKWKAVPVSDVYKPVYSTPVYLVPKCAQNLVLDIYGADDSDGAVVQLWKKNGTLAQQWNMLDLGDGVITLVTNLGIHRAVDVVGGGK